MLTRRGFVIEKSELSLDLTNKIKKELTVNIPTGFAQLSFGAGQPTSFQIYLENKDKFCIPRYYAQSIGLAQQNDHRTKLIEDSVKCPALVFAGSLNASKQQDVAALKIRDAFAQNGGGILSLPTGYGKTVVGIHTMCDVKLKTIIVVHKEFLVEQWRERIEAFVPSAKVGIIRQNKVDIEDKDVVIAMLQTLISKDYPASTFFDFGLAIFDEVHHLSAPVFSKALFKVCPPLILGLSATPKRKDGLSWVLEHYIGPVFFQVHRKHESHVEVKRIDYAPPADKTKYTDDLPRLPNGKHFDYNGVTNLLVGDTDRNRMIVDLIVSSLRSEPSRNFLLLTDRRGHCELLYDLLFQAKSKRNIDVRPGIYYGGMKTKDLKNAADSNVILATYSFANEGLDIEKLNSIVLATPKGDVVQAVGRILRDGAGKKKDADAPVPCVYDIVDAHRYFETKFAQRKVFYKKSGFNLLQKEATVASQCDDLNDSQDREESKAFAFMDD